MNILKASIALLLALFLIGLLVLNIHLYYQPKFIERGNAQLNQDLLQQLAHLKTALHNGAADDMQGVYPEGYVFLNALYGLTWAEVAKNLPTESVLFQEAQQEIDWVLIALDSEEGRRPFSPDLALPCGIFYRGWSNYVLGIKLKLMPAVYRDSIEVYQFHQNCRDIAEALKKQESPFLESYEQACWPADMVVGMASVAMYEKMYPGEFDGLLKNWLAKVETKTDSFGLIPHSARWQSGANLESARGSSQSLILNFLIEIDAGYAQRKFLIYKKHFLEYRFGLPGIREYPKGQAGTGDIDSGPVIWGIGGAASIVGQRVLALYGESAAAIGVRNSIEVFACGRSGKQGKTYLLGKLPIADAFIGWSNSVEAEASRKLRTSELWWLSTQLLLLLVYVLGGYVVFKLSPLK